MGYNVGINGTIPGSLSLLTNVVDLALGGCQLTGTLPVGLSALVRMTYLELEVCVDAVFDCWLHFVTEPLCWHCTGECAEWHAAHRVQRAPLVGVRLLCVCLCIVSPSGMLTTTIRVFLSGPFMRIRISSLAPFLPHGWQCRLSSTYLDALYRRLSGAVPGRV